MSLYKDVARDMIRRKGEEISQLEPDEAKYVMKQITEKARLLSQDDMIKYISAGHKELTPELEKEIQDEQLAIAKENEMISKNPLAAVSRPSMQGLSVSTGARQSVLKEKKREAEMQRLGIQTRGELPVGNLELGFGTDRVKTLSSLLSDHFGKDVTVFERDNEFLYLDPDDGIIKRANPTGASVIGYGLPVTGDIVGTIGGNFAFSKSGPAGKVVGESIGSAVGTGTGEFIRLSIGKALGAHDLTFDQIFNKAGIEGLKAGATTGAVGATMAGAKGIYNFARAGNYTKKAALDAGMTSKQADLALDEVNRILGRKGVKGTAAGRTTDAAVVSKEAEVRKSILYAQKFADRDAEDMAALSEALNKLSVKGEAKGGAKIASIFGEKTAKRIEKAKGIVVKNVDDLTRKLKAMGTSEVDEAGDMTRSLILAKREAADQAQKSAWKDVEKVGGFSPDTKTYGIDIEIGDSIKGLKDIFKRRAKTGITTIPGKKAGGIFTGSKKADLADFQREISDVRDELRKAYSATDFGSKSANDLKAIEKALVDERNASLAKAGREDLLEAIVDAESKTREFYKKFDQNIIGDIMTKKSSGVFKLKSKDLGEKMLKGDADEFADMLSYIKDNPQAVQAWKDSFASQFRKTAFTNGKYNRKAGEEFLTKNNGVLKQVFSEKELSGFAATGDLAEKVAKQSTQLKSIITKATKEFGTGKLAGLDPDNIVKFVTDGAGSFLKPAKDGVKQKVGTVVSKIKYMKNSLKNHPDAWSGFQNEYMDSMRKEVLDSKTGFIDPSRMNKWAIDNADVVKEVMGDKYLKDLQSINTVLQNFNKKMIRLTNDEMDAAIVQAGRTTFAPPLTARGRALTGVIKLKDRYHHKMVAEAFLDPEKLNKAAKIVEHKDVTRVTAELAASLGLMVED